MKHLAICVLVGSMIASEPIPRVRNVHLGFQVVLKEIPAQSKQADVWLPLLHDDPYQRITNLKIESPMKYKIASAPDGNRMLHAALRSATTTPMTISIALDAAREEHIQLKVSHEESKTELAKYLKPDRLVPLTVRFEIGLGT